MRRLRDLGGMFQYSLSALPVCIIHISLAYNTILPLPTPVAPPQVILLFSIPIHANRVLGIQETLGAEAHVLLLCRSTITIALPLPIQRCTTKQARI